jgi:hypothetical protein
VGTNSSYSIKAEYCISSYVSFVLFYLNHEVLPITINPRSKITNSTWGLEGNCHLLNKNKFNVTLWLSVGYKNPFDDSMEHKTPKSSYKRSQTEPGYVVGIQAGLMYQISNDFWL